MQFEEPSYRSPGVGMRPSVFAKLTLNLAKTKAALGHVFTSKNGASSPKRVVDQDT
jgi:hypothetical protein